MKIRAQLRSWSLQNNAFAGSVAGDRGGFSVNQSKPWRHDENSQLLYIILMLGDSIVKTSTITMFAVFVFNNLNIIVQVFFYKSSHINPPPPPQKSL